MNERLKRIYEKLRREFYRTPTIILRGIPTIIGIGFFIIYEMINPGGYSDNAHADFLIPLGIFTLGLSGIPMIIKQETGIQTGVMAVIEGLLLLVVGCGLGLGFFYFMYLK